MLWEALAGEHPFWGVPLPEVARGDRGRRAAARDAARPTCRKPLLAAVARALDARPGAAPAAAALAAELRARARRRAARRSGAPRPRPTAAPRAASAAPSARAPRSSPPALAGVAAARRRPLLPFWPPGLVVGARARGSAGALRARRGSGSPSRWPHRCFPLGNVAQAAAVALRRARARLARAVLARRPRRPRVLRRPAARAVRRAGAAAARRPARPRPGAPRAAHAAPACSRPRPSRVCAVRRCRSRRASSATSASPAASGRRRRRRARTTSARRNPASSPSRCVLALAAGAASRSRAAAGRGAIAALGAGQFAARCSSLAAVVPGARRTRARGTLRLLCAVARRADSSRAAARLEPRRRPPGMSVLRSIESKIEGLFEGVFGRAFRTHVQPVELARKLAKEMDEHRSVSVSRVYVPNEYTVYLSPADRAAVRLVRGLARRRAAGVPRRARAPRGLRAADATARADHDRRRPRHRRVRDRHPGRPAAQVPALAALHRAPPHAPSRRRR